MIRLTAKRKLFFHGKWVPATRLRNQRKGKIKAPLVYKGKSHDAYLSHVKVQVTASKKDIYLVLVYGLTEHPMMLATNKEIRSKDDVIRVAKLYFSRWRKIPISVFYAICRYFRNADKNSLEFPCLAQVQTWEK